MCLARIEVEPADRVLMDAHIRLLVEEVPNGMSHRRLLEQARRYLVEKRLKGVVVVLVDDDDVNVALGMNCDYFVRRETLPRTAPGTAPARTKSLVLHDAGDLGALVRSRSAPTRSG